jgi:hypothetical protein
VLSIVAKRSTVGPRIRWRAVKTRGLHLLVVLVEFAAEVVHPNVGR